MRSMRSMRSMRGGVVTAMRRLYWQCRATVCCKKPAIEPEGHKYYGGIRVTYQRIERIERMSCTGYARQSRWLLESFARRGKKKWLARSALRTAYYRLRNNLTRIMDNNSPQRIERRRC